MPAVASMPRRSARAPCRSSARSIRPGSSPPCTTSRCRARGCRDHHRRDRRRVVGALVVVDRDQAVHERARGHQRHVAERAGAHLLLGPASLRRKRSRPPRRAASVMARSTRADSPRSASGFSISIGTPRSTAAMIGSTCRCSSVAMMRRSPPALEQLAVVVGDESAPIFSRRRARGCGSSRRCRSTAPPDGAPRPRRGTARPGRRRRWRARPLRLPSHRLPPAISATAESASFDSGRSTGSLRSAERSAAV